MVGIKDIADRMQNVRGRIESAAGRAGRQAHDVKLVVVSKGQPETVVRAAVEAGVRRLGENYAEEALDKKKSVDPDRLVEWHMVGSVQSRKAAMVAQHFDMLHSLDRVKLARRLQQALVAVDRRLPALVQVNISAEATKSGLSVRDPSEWPVIAEFLRQLQAFDRLEIRGLMSIPPYSQDPEAARPYFRKTRQLRDTLVGNIPELDLAELSMGMSGDFEIAVEEGATLVRIGTAILGRRPG